MVDISKCEGNGCSKKESCKRYTAPASGLQSYIFVEKVGEQCEYFMPNNKVVTDWRMGRAEMKL